jgi:hypothetical protein
VSGDDFDEGPTLLDVELIPEDNAVPEPIADDAPTAPRCLRCNRIVQLSVDFEPRMDVLMRAGVCWRPEGARWWFCSGRRPAMLVQYREG